MMLRMTTLSPERRVAGLISGTGLGREQLIHAIRSRIDSAGGKIQLDRKELFSAFAGRLATAAAETVRLRGKLEALNPLRVLDRGYSLVTDPEGKVLTGRKQAMEAGDIRIRFSDGEVEAKVNRAGERY
jgi:exodeoxyribonuclease VII large subunit